MKKNQQNIKFYESYYSKEYDFKGDEKYYNYLLSKIDLNLDKPVKILDVGCGIGALGYFLFKKNPNLKIFGIDISAAGIKTAKKNGVIGKVADIEKKWPFQSKSFDLVFGQEIIEHLVDTDIFIKESSRVLKKDGLLVITTPNLGAWYNRILLLLGFQPFFTEVSTIDKTLGISFTRKLTKVREPLGHLRVFTLRALKDLLKLHKFKPVTVKGGKAFFLPRFIHPFDELMSNFPSLSSDLIVISKKSSD